MERSNVFEVQRDNAFTTSTTSSDPTEELAHLKKTRTSRKKSATAECPPTTKKTICRGKSKACQNSSQTTKSSLTLDQASTSSAKGSLPYWSDLAKDKCQKLWLPTETDCAASHSNCSRGSFKSTASNSWFSMKEWKVDTPRENLSKTSTYSIVESMEDENTKKARRKKVTWSKKKDQESKANRSRKFRLFPNADTTKIFRKWFGCVRKTYNLALEEINKSDDPKTLLNVPDLRKMFVTRAAVERLSESLNSNLQYLLECPKEVRDGALDDLVSAFKSNFAMRKKNPEHQFKVKFRSRKNEQSIALTTTAIRKINDVPEDRTTSGCREKEIRLFPTYLKNAIRLRLQRNKHCVLGEKVEHTCRLESDALGRFYLCVPYHVPARDNQASGVPLAHKHPWVALDPGCRTFQTLYSPSHDIAFKAADGDVSRLYRLCIHLDNLISKASLCTHPKRKKSFRRAQARMRNRIKNLVKEVHWKLALFLVRKFENIIIPEFASQEMVCKQRMRKIGSKTARAILTWSHYTFRCRLLQKAAEHNSNVFVVDERYTTKTCGSCLKINDSVGVSKVFKCPYCGACIDRDANGARNIFMKSVREGDLSDFASLQPEPCEVSH